MGNENAVSVPVVRGEHRERYRRSRVVNGVKSEGDSSTQLHHVVVRMMGVQMLVDD